MIYSIPGERVTIGRKCGNGSKLMRIAFLGSSEFALPALEAVVEAGHSVVRAYCQPARPAGRGKKPRATIIEKRASELGLEVRSPTSLVGAQDEFARLELDAGVVAAYGNLLPRSILGIPSGGFLNIHPSLLPRWRGAAPVQRAIMEGDRATGVCIMKVVEELDAGPVLLKRTVPILDDDTSKELGKKLSELGAAMIVDALGKLGDLTGSPQAANGVRYARKIEKSETRVDWRKPAIEVDRKIRGLSASPGAWCEIKGERVKLLGSEVVEAKGEPGQVLDDCFTVACGFGAVRVTEAQRAGKSRLASAEYLRGSPISQGTMISS